MGGHSEPLMPSGLYDYVNRVVYMRILEKLKHSQSINVEQFVDDCVYFSYNWMSAHIMGCHELDSFTTMEEIIDSFRQDCPDASIAQTCQDAFTITFSESYWTIHYNNWTENTPIRISFKNHTHRAFAAMNESPAILKHLNALIPEFRKTIRKHILDASRQMLISLIYKTSDIAKTDNKDTL